MKNNVLISSMCIASAMTAVLPNILLGQEAVDNDNRFGFNAQFMFNVPARFRNLSTTPNPGADATSHGLNRNYNDGSVLPDESGGSDHRTRNWGYNNDSQYNAAAQTLTMTATGSPANGYDKTADGDPQPGFEFSYGRALTRFSVGETKITLGLGASFSYTALDIKDRSALSGNVSSTTDTYDTSNMGASFPTGTGTGYHFSSTASYSPLLNDTPFSRVSSTTAATSVLQNELEGNLYGFKLGPFIEIPVYKIVSVQLQGGMALVAADLKFTSAETLTAAGATTVLPTTSASRTDWMVGGFVGARVNVAVKEWCTVFVGADYQNVGTTSVINGNKRVDLDLGQAIFLNAGVGFTF